MSDKGHKRQRSKATLSLIGFDVYDVCRSAMGISDTLKNITIGNHHKATNIIRMNLT